MKEYKIKINGNEYAVTVKNTDGETAEVSVNGTEYSVAIEGLRARPATKTPRLVRTPAPESTPRTPEPRPAAAGGAGSTIKSPLPGVILGIDVREGDTVKAGQRVMLLEAMKMENNIEADQDGVVKSIKVRQGDSVLEGDALIVIG